MMRTTIAAISLCLCTAVALPQVAVPPPPKPADSGPSLADTMKFIEKVLNTQETIRFTVHQSESPSGFVMNFMQTVDFNNAHADAQTCQIRYAMKIVHTSLDPNNSFSEQPKFDPYSIDLKQMSTLKLVPFATFNAYGKILNDVPQVAETTTDIPITVLTLQPSQKSASPIYLADEEMADRFAKAMVHAIELCGGGNKDPF